MFQFIQECFAAANLPFTIALLIVMGYWLLAIVGGIGFEVFDFDFGADIDGESLSVAGFIKGVTNFFYLGDIPVVIVGSIFVLLIWVVSMISNHYLNPDFSFWVMLLWLIPNMVLSLLGTKLLLIPIAAIFPKKDHSITRDDFFGKLGVITTSEVTDQFGQMEIQQNGPPILLNVRCRSGQRLGRGDAAKIIGYRQQDDTFLVELSKWEKT